MANAAVQAMAPGGFEPERKTLPFVFTGTGGQYFGIWIVNLLLTILTLGVWSAWAKVRRLRFFYGNTSLDKSHFEYLATGKQLLLGRILAIVAIGIYVGGDFIMPGASSVVALAFIPAFPWIMNRSLRFNSRMTAWRNVRLNFTGNYGEAFIAYILMPMIGVLSLGLLLPRTHRYTARYVLENLHFGESPFEAEPPLARYYIAWLKAIGLFLVGVAIPVAVIAISLTAFAMQVQSGILGPDIKSNAIPSVDAIALTQIMLGIIFLISIGVAAYYRALVRNVLLNYTRLDQRHEFESTLSGFGFGWTIITNLVFTMCTLGLYYPFGQVRLWRYQCEHLTAIPHGSLEDFVDEQPLKGDVFSSEFADIEAFDIGI